MRFVVVRLALWFAFAAVIWPLDTWRYVLASIILLAALYLED